MTRWHGIDYRNDTTVVTLYDTETSDELVRSPNSSQYLEQLSQMPDYWTTTFSHFITKDMS